MNIEDSFETLKIGKASLNDKILCAFKPIQVSSGKIGDGFDGKIFKEELLTESKFSPGHCGTDVYVQGKSFASCAHDLAASLGLSAEGGYCGASFKGGVAASFKNRGATESSTLMIKQERQYQIGAQPIGVIAPRKYLTDEAKEMIDTMDPKALFEQVGLYFATKIVFGGSYTLYASTEESGVESATEFAAAVTAEMEYAGNKGNVDSKITNKSSSKAKSFSYTATQHVIGGDLQKFTFSAAKGADELFAKEKAWCDSVFTYPVVINANLAPIYWLAEGERAEELAAAFQKFTVGEEEKKAAAIARKKAAIDEYTISLREGKWHNHTRAPTQTAIFKLMEKVQWPEDLKIDYETYLSKATWHCAKRAPTLSKLEDLAREYKQKL